MIYRMNEGHTLNIIRTVGRTLGRLLVYLGFYDKGIEP